MVLVGVVRVGMLRQRVDKEFAVLGAPPKRRGVDRGPGRVTVQPVPEQPGLWAASTPLTWLGGWEARQRWSGELSASITEACGKAGPAPTGVRLPGRGGSVTTPHGRDQHVLEVASVAEQEVLCNLLRQHAALLIAVTGRCPDGPGSRRLAESREHVTTRYLGSTYPAYLHRMAAWLRHHEGLTGLDRMDVHPSQEPDGTLTVTVRCIDAAASVATTRAHAVLLATFALRAQRLVRAGVAVPESPLAVLDEDRSRAVARGLAGSQRGGAAGRSAPARRLLRRLLTDTLAVELDNLEVTAAELFPVIAPVDLPEVGLAGLAREDSVLSRWAAAGPVNFAELGRQALLDPREGGPCLAASHQHAPGRTGVLLDSWQAVIAARRGGDLDAASSAGRAQASPPPGTRRERRRREAPGAGQ